jgi:hypothetical protein
MASIIMKSFSRIIVKAGIIIGLAVTGLILVLIILLTCKMPWHQYQLWILQKNFQSIVNTDSAAQSNLLAEFAIVDHWGNSNLCDYYVGQFRSSPLPKETLEEVYSNLVINSFPHDANNALKPEVYFIGDEIFNDYYYSNLLKRYLPHHLPTDQNIYLVWTSSDSHSPDGDIRCH